MELTNTVGHKYVNTLVGNTLSKRPFQVERATDGGLTCVRQYNDTGPVATTTAVVTIRIPCGADGNLVTDAEERLSQAAGIANVKIDELYSIDPKLSATVVTVGVTMRLTTPMTDTELRENLADVPGLESVDRIC